MIVRDGHVGGGRPAPALIATLSSPAWMKQWVMVTLVELPGSMPSVLRARLVIRFSRPRR